MPDMKCEFVLNWFVSSLRRGRPTYFLDEVADDGVVEILNIGPLYAL